MYSITAHGLVGHNFLCSKIWPPKYVEPLSWMYHRTGCSILKLMRDILDSTQHVKLHCKLIRVDFLNSPHSGGNITKIHRYTQNPSTLRINLKLEYPVHIRNDFFVFIWGDFHKKNLRWEGVRDLDEIVDFDSCLMMLYSGCSHCCYGIEWTCIIPLPSVTGLWWSAIHHVHAGLFTATKMQLT